MSFQRSVLPLLALLALPGFVLVMWISPELDHQFFCAGESSCFREWVAALSGYFAVGAAALTIGEMARQRQLQTEIQRENVELQILGQLTAARSVLTRVSTAKMLLPLIYQSGAWQVPANDWLMDHQVGSLFRVFAGIRSILSHSEFGEFEKISGGLYSHESIVQELERVERERQELMSRVNDPNILIVNLFETAGAQLQIKAQFATNRLENYISGVEARAKEFIDKWEARVTLSATAEDV